MTIHLSDIGINTMTIYEAKGSTVICFLSPAVLACIICSQRFSLSSLSCLVRSSVKRIPAVLQTWRFLVILHMPPLCWRLVNCTNAERHTTSSATVLEQFPQANITHPTWYFHPSSPSFSNPPIPASFLSVQLAGLLMGSSTAFHRLDTWVSKTEMFSLHSFTPAALNSIDLVTLNRVSGRKGMNEWTIQWG